jgi:hypothetical protein
MKVRHLLSAILLCAVSAMAAKRGAAKPPEPVDSSKITTPARCVRQAVPGYTYEMLQRTVQGTISTRVLIGNRGIVKRVVVLNDLGYGSAAEAEKSIKRSRFAPALIGKTPAESWITLDVSFLVVKPNAEARRRNTVLLMIVGFAAVTIMVVAVILMPR